jgi:hypothetical protein
LYFFICRETAANKNHHAFGKYNTTLNRPKSLGFFLAAVSRPGKRKNHSVISVPQAKRVVKNQSVIMFKCQFLAMGLIKT